MKKNKRNKMVGKGSSAGTVLLCVFGFSGAAKAQSVLAPLPNYTPAPPAVQGALDEQGMGFLGPTGLGLSPALMEPSDWLRWGPTYLLPHFLYSASYATGLQATPGDQQASIVQRFAPGGTFIIGSHWVLDYTPTFTFYSQKDFKDTLDHAVSLSWGTYYDDWSFGFGQSISIADDPTVETGAQTSTQSYGTSLSASHVLNSVLSVDFSASQSILSADQFSSSKTWSTMEWLNYQFLPGLDGSIGAGGGYNAVSEGPNMSFEDLQLRITWRIAKKLSAVVHGGVEDRQYIHGGIPDTLSPLYGASITYVPFEHTTMSVAIDHSTSPSLFNSQVSESTTMGFSITQRFFEKFSVTGGVNYNQVNFDASSINFPVVIIGTNGVPVQVGVGTTTVPGRQDSGYSVNGGVSWSFLKRASASVTYSYSANASSLPGFGYSSSQAGVEVDYHF